MFDVLQCILLILIYLEVAKITKVNQNVPEVPTVYNVGAVAPAEASAHTEGCEADE